MTLQSLQGRKPVMKCRHRFRIKELSEQQGTQTAPEDPVSHRLFHFSGGKHPVIQPYARENYLAFGIAWILITV